MIYFQALNIELGEPLDPSKGAVAWKAYHYSSYVDEGVAANKDEAIAAAKTACIAWLEAELERAKKHF